MAKVRAYKIAEELGLDKQELLLKAAEIGIQLRSALVGVDEEQAETLRRRLGGTTTQAREEKRIGTSVIRRRRKKQAALRFSLWGFERDDGIDSLGAKIGVVFSW